MIHKQYICIVYGVYGTQNDVDVQLNGIDIYTLKIKKLILKRLLIWLIRILKMLMIYQ